MRMLVGTLGSRSAARRAASGLDRRGGRAARDLCLEQADTSLEPGLQPGDQLLQRLERAAASWSRTRSTASSTPRPSSAWPVPPCRSADASRPAAEQNLAMPDLTNAFGARGRCACSRAARFSPLELIDAALARIAAVDPAVNAVPTLCAERAREQARRLTGRHRRDRPRLARRAAGADQGPGRGRGGAHDLRLADLRGPRARVLGLAGRAARGRGRHRAGQDQHARSSAPAPTPSTRCSAPPATRGTRRSPAAAPRAARRWRWRPAWPGSPTAPTSAARCARRPPSAASWACGPRRAGCRTGRAAAAVRHPQRRGADGPRRARRRPDARRAWPASTRATR